MSDSTPIAASSGEAAPLRALCVARHSFLSEHLARYFRNMGVVTSQAVGLSAATPDPKSPPPDVVICDYDLLASVPLDQWENDELLSTTPVVAVSLTRQSEELHLFNSSGIAGFLYLPTLEETPALKILRAAAARSKFKLAAPKSAPRVAERS
jgi:DNA-binding NarL/FixJ family response regulator